LIANARFGFLFDQTTSPDGSSSVETFRRHVTVACKSRAHTLICAATSRADNQRQSLSADTESRRRAAGDDRVDELPEGSVDDDRVHVHSGHADILRGHGAGRATS